MGFHIKDFKCVLFFYTSDLNETLSESLTVFYSINYLTIYRAYIVHQKEPMCGLSKESKIFHQCSKYGLYNTHIAL